jgi:hypothetical protein
VSTAVDGVRFNLRLGADPRTAPATPDTPGSARTSVSPSPEPAGHRVRGPVGAGEHALHGREEHHRPRARRERRVTAPVLARPEALEGRAQPSTASRPIFPAKTVGLLTHRAHSRCRFQGGTWPAGRQPRPSRTSGRPGGGPGAGGSRCPSRGSERTESEDIEKLDAKGLMFLRPRTKAQLPLSPKGEGDGG